MEMTTIIYKTKDCSKEIIVHDVENVSYNSASKVLTIGSRTGWGYLDIADIEYFNIYQEVKGMTIRLQKKGCDKDIYYYDVEYAYYIKDFKCMLMLLRTKDTEINLNADEIEFIEIQDNEIWR